MTEPLPAPETARILPDLRELLYAGRYQEAADRVCSLAAEENPGYADTRWIDPLIGAATLVFRADETLGGHQRSVDLSTGLVTLRDHGPDRWLTHEIFVSRPADAVVLRTTADGPISGTLTLGPLPEQPPAPMDITTRAEPGVLTLAVTFPCRWNGAIDGYTVTCRVRTTGGSASPQGDALRISDASEVLVVARVEVTGPPGRWSTQHAPDLADLLSTADHEAMLADHSAVHRELFDRVALCLRGSEAVGSRGSTEELLADPADPELIAALFDAGRYAIISSSGELPPTLQGVWSGTYQPAWRSGYTLNGNLPMALSSVLPTRCPELLLPLFNWLAENMDDFRENARRAYGVEGILLPTHGSSHGKLNHFGPIWCQTFWTAGAAWLARFHYGYWRATGDIGFLAQRAIPFMAEAARFCEGFLVEGDSSGTVVFLPSYSPENTPAGTASQACINATMDVAAVRDLLRNLLDCERAARRAGLSLAELGLAEDDPGRWRGLLDKLPPYQIDPDGGFAEWLWPGLANNPAHRHASHLYPFWYGDSEVLSNPQLAAAGRQAIEQRLAWWRGDDETGEERPGEMAFGLVMLGMAAARLGMAETAHEIVTQLARDYWLPSFVSTHNTHSIFNVDICGGMTALVIAMLVGGDGDTIDLLPALPEAWQRGEIRGVAGSDQVTISRLAWTPERMEVELTAQAEHRVTIGIGNTHTTVTVGPDRPTHLIASRERHHAPSPAVGTP